MNTSGSTGVNYSATTRTWVGSWLEGGKRKSRAFAIGKWGDEEARAMAQKARDEAATRLGNDNGKESGWSEKQKNSKKRKIDENEEQV